MAEFRYKDMVGRYSKAIAAELTKMEAIYNFNHGEEFEIACCHILRSLLPSKYGICRGHIITSDNQQAGDDLIIYDRDNSPTLRLLPEGDYSRKEYIPVESVYAYIEAKHNLIVAGGDENLSKALEQVEAAKNLPREDRPHNEILPGVFCPEGSIEPTEKSDPKRSNPMYGVILSRNLTCDDSDLGLLRTEASRLESSPDLIIAGPDYLASPVYKEDDRKMILRVFRSTSNYFAVDNIPARAFSVGLLVLLYSLHFIDLKAINWAPVFLEQINAHKAGA